MALALYCGLLPAASGTEPPIDESKFPPVAPVKIDFGRDIRPILENNCFRCHGPEKPKSKFRLDNRESALKGGENGVDILPGNSAKSPLIRYVAQLDPDIKMPPPDKAKPLPKDQISLLRAWIDQGVVWETNAPPPQLAFSVTPTLQAITVSGNEGQFREHLWQPEGWNGGAENFELREQLSPDSRFTASGHVLRDDYKLNLALDRNDKGFIHAGWEQYRKYYNDVGGYYPGFNPPALSLDRDLHLDIGRAWIDFGLTLPNWPQMIFGCEYQYKRGEKSMLDWGDVTQAGVDRKIAPASKEIDEYTHILKFDLEHQIAGVRILENFRGEFYHLNTRQTNVIGFLNAPSGVAEGYSHFQGANTIRLEKQVNPWFFASGGYLYSKLNADSSFTAQSLELAAPASSQITLERESHVFNLNSFLGPWSGLTLSGALQGEWTRQQGLGNSSFDELFPSTFFTPQPALEFSDLNQRRLTENFAVRYSKIPFTALFAELQTRQESIGQFDEEYPGVNDFLQKTAFSSQSYDFRAGFNTSPWRWVSLSAHYRRYDHDSRYQNNADQQPIGFPGIGYPAFITARDLATDEVETKAVFRPTRWLKTTLSYKQLTTDYRTDTDSAPLGITPGGPVAPGKSDSHIYSVNATLTPRQRLYLSGTFMYQDSSTITFNNASPAVAPYRGDTYSALASGTYVLNQNTDLLLSYSFSYADFSQNNYAGGLPAGIRYQQHQLQAGIGRRLGSNLSTRLQYGYFYYNEPSFGTVNNYTAHAIFASLTYQFR